MIQRIMLGAEEENDELGALADFIEDLPYDHPSPDHIFKLYGIFLRDLSKNPLVVKGIVVTYNRSRSRHPICKGKAQAFEHIITREDKVTGKRYFDRERANKIHWIRPIICNADDSRIKYFERINDKGQNQLFYWYEAKSFVVILREVNPDLMLITSFSVDEGKKRELREWYYAYR